MISTKVNTNMDNLIDADKSMIKELAGEGVKVVSNSDNLRVVSTKDEDIITYTLDMVNDLKGVTLISGNKSSITFAEDKNNIDRGNAVLSNVADGKIAPDSKDVVNGGQLYHGYGGMANISNEVEHVKAEVIDTAALNAALSGLKPLAYKPGEATQIMVAVGGYRGSKAIVIGAAHYNNEDELVHGGVSYNGKKALWNLGISWRFDGKKKAETPNEITSNNESAEISTLK